MPALRASLIVLLASGASFAQKMPNLRKQKAWGPAEKQQLLKYLESGKQPAIKGRVKESAVKNKPESEDPGRPWYINASVVTDTVLTVGSGGSLANEGTGLGPKVLVGGHLFSWIRLYGGVQYNRFRADKLDNTRAAVNHWQIPVGMELALVPLGTPQTRYIILRGGFSWHNFSSKTPSAEFKNRLSGWQGAWNLGIGYEWQIPESTWRINILAEGYNYLWRQAGSARFYGLGLTGGVTYAF